LADQTQITPALEDQTLTHAELLEARAAVSTCNGILR